jgi:hypothetical protein
MAVRVHTRHTILDGEPATIRRVVLEDAAGREHPYRFRALADGGHEYLGEGDPSDRAREVLDRFEAADEWDGVYPPDDAGGDEAA